MTVCVHIKAKGLPAETTLYEHLLETRMAAEKFSGYFGKPIDIAIKGAILHDIGKASPEFQKRLFSEKRLETPFRHEIASCFFLSLFDEEIQPYLIEMIIGHHKSVLNDARGKGILDLDESRTDVFDLHIKDWDNWKGDALSILSSLGIETRDISKGEAKVNYEKVLDYCEEKVLERGYSEWRGMLMAADHFSSAMLEKTEKYLQKTFKNPNLEFFNRKHELYPLSLKNSVSEKKHTMVVACTGAGKTDFLFRRCKGRVFYTLPFQASINAMYKRVKHDLIDSNPDLDIRLLHASSSIVVDSREKEEKVFQGHVGAAIKILTPHQIASIAFGTNGYEATLLDIKGCDVILDEIHTYTNVTRAIVLKIVEVLNNLGCRIHIGTATMPAVLYNRIIDILGRENVLEVSLESVELEKFNRHIIYKRDNWEDVDSVVDNAVEEEKKVLLVCNRVKNAQERYRILKKKYLDVPILLIHSRFKRGDREEKERLLIGLDTEGNPTYDFNTSDKACIVISTQVVEVSLDISFDLMITEAAPIDAMIQRFGRVNRKRSVETIGKYKPIYVLAPPEDKKEALPYDIDIIKSSYSVIPNGEVLKESSLQLLVDKVFTEIDFMKIEEHSVFKGNGKWTIDKLTHNSKAILLDLLNIDSVSCICESDEEVYKESCFEDRVKMEVSTRYYVVKDLRQLDCGATPFIIPDVAYDEDLGFDIEKAKAEFYDAEYSFL